MESRPPSVRSSLALWEPSGGGGGQRRPRDLGFLSPPPWLPVCLSARPCRDQAPRVASRRPLPRCCRSSFCGRPSPGDPPPGLGARLWPPSPGPEPSTYTLSQQQERPRLGRPHVITPSTGAEAQEIS